MPGVNGERGGLGYSYALRLLARREHSEHELRQKLLRRKFPLDEIKQVIKELASQNWQSDTRFAQAYFNSRVQQGFGPVKIAYELRQRGIANDLINQVIMRDEAFWQEQLDWVWDKKYSTREEASPQQIRFLLSRGFTQEHIKKLFYEKQ